MTSGPVYDRFNLPQSVTNNTQFQPVTDVQTIPSNNFSWGPSTPDKSTRTMSLQSFDTGITERVVNGRWTIPAGRLLGASLIYTYNANGGNTADFKNLNIILTPLIPAQSGNYLNANMIITDVNGAFSSPQTFIVDGTYQWFTSTTQGIDLTRVTSMKISFSFGELQIDYDLTSLRSIITPSGGSGGNGSINQCGY